MIASFGEMFVAGFFIMFPDPDLAGYDISSFFSLIFNHLYRDFAH